MKRLGAAAVALFVLGLVESWARRQRLRWWLGWDCRVGPIFFRVAPFDLPIITVRGAWFREERWAAIELGHSGSDQAFSIGVEFRS